ncbi:MAG: iron uptake transporter deferrochelatase/peroxidase subunit [Solirubrobacteraceae bacterium]|jgi:deferrochelatase/peroxidase EfeB|nr:iron uptake transporter deferrochelatase/peroxidase subunit [Solirubrobacteraceae bacterium]
MSAKVSRRGFLTAAGGAAAGAVAGAGLVAVAGDDDETPAAPPGTGRVAFDGAHQAGIITPAQDRLHFAAFDVVPGATRADLRELLAAWTGAARRMTAGLPARPLTANPAAPPADTGEAAGLPPARLTVTFGLGPGLFAAERFGLTARRPVRLAPLPALPADELDPARSGGDLAVQACADDPQVAFHAVRNLARIGRGVVVMRWSQLGFGRTSSTSSAQETPRNLMGFKDGTNNLTAEETDELRRHLWAAADEPAWMAGGTYLVARRIRMLIEVWDRASLDDQEATFGRRRASGAPLTGSRERDPVDLAAQGADGPLIPPGAHIRLAAPETNDGIRLLRRGYSFTDGFDAELGQLDAGLFFVSFQRDPQAFVRVQTRLGREDALNEYIKHVGSAVFAVPGGTRPGRPVAEQLFA